MENTLSSWSLQKECIETVEKGQILLPLALEKKTCEGSIIIYQAQESRSCILTVWAQLFKALQKLLTFFRQKMAVFLCIICLKF